MASKAAKWAIEYERAQGLVRAAACQRPGIIVMPLLGADKIQISLENTGEPRLILPSAQNGYLIAAKDLCTFARMILATFGDQEGA